MSVYHERLWCNLIFMTVVLQPTRAYKQRDQLVTLGHASVELVMGRYFTPDTVER